MIPPNKEELLSLLQASGHQPLVITSVAGASLLVLPHGGRVLGLFSERSGINFLWTNPALADAASAKAYLSSDDWHNSGGDRTWLAPEIDFFFPHFPDLTTYFQPRDLDPGNYRVLDQEFGSDAHPTCAIRNELELELKRSCQRYDLRITKNVGTVSNPITDSGIHDSNDPLEFAGYRMHTSLEILKPDSLINGDSQSCIGIWNLLQLPHGGEMLIPTYCRSEPTTFFGEIPSNDLRVKDRLIRYAMRAIGEQKISVRAFASTGRAGYMFRQGEEFCLVVRNFGIDPSGKYVDVWGTRLDDSGYAFQACNINGKLGSFSELEYHAPAIGGNTGHRRSDDVSVVWAFRGSEQAIQRAANLLLGKME